MWHNIIYAYNYTRATNQNQYDKLEGIRSEIAGVRDEVSKLNQNHVEHMECHYNKAED